MRYKLLYLVITNQLVLLDSPPGPSGISSLDKALSLISSSGLSLNRGDVIEIQGSAASGKTTLVYQFALKCILPVETHIPDSEGNKKIKLDLGGWGKAAVILDNDMRWDILCLDSLLNSYLKPRLCGYLSGEELQKHVEELVKESLCRVHVFRPTSSASVAATLLRLPAYHRQHMPSQEIALLCVDSMSSFYWTDRYTLEQRIIGSTSDKSALIFPMSRILFALQELRLNLGPVIVLTNWGLSHLTSSGDIENDSADATQGELEHNLLYRQHLYPFPAPFESPPRLIPNAHKMPPITHHITLLPRPNDSAKDNMKYLMKISDPDISAQEHAGGTEIRGIIRGVETGRTSTFSINRGEYTWNEVQTSTP